MKNEVNIGWMIYSEPIHFVDEFDNGVTIVVTKHEVVGETETIEGYVETNAK